MDQSDILQEACDVYIGDNNTKIGYTSGGVSLSLEHDIIENTPDQSSIVNSIITNNHTASISIPYAEWDKNKLIEICPYLDIADESLSFQNFYHFTETIKLRLIFESYIFEFPYTIPIISFERSYNKEDIRITNIDFKIITKNVFFNLMKYYHIYYEVQIGDDKLILTDNNNQYIEEEEWRSKQ